MTEPTPPIEVTQSDLLPCPFCASDRIAGWSIGDSIRKGMQAVCEDCRATGSAVYNGPNNDTVERATAAWNTRLASSPAVAGDDRATRHAAEIRDKILTEKDEVERAFLGRQMQTALHIAAMSAPATAVEEMGNEEIVQLVRDAAHEVFGGNATFADDDVARLKAAALRTDAAPTVAEGMVLPRLTEKMIRAACKAHYRSEMIDGIDLSVDGINYSFRQGFKRMWKGVRAAMIAAAQAPGGKS